MLFFFAGLNVFLSPLFLMISPLVLSFAHPGRRGRVAFAAGAACFLGGLAMTLWGGPRRLRMRGVHALHPGAGSDRSACHRPAGQPRR